ncbi:MULTISPECIES: alpha/beta hydrolase [Actinosynnema]|uniref:alpha/beta hydrolase n=1 Tax=Actinosynnema TaxID=40566 RepID=UPI0020A263A3|nr:alpha/beta hydrolase [Actinosynnema pretiosum]MCP2096991.1 acetyl esterase [Actinosynnema pretiosum]
MPKLADRVPTGVLAAGLRAAFALPAPVRRLLTGPPRVVDGQPLHPDTQLLLRMQELSGTGWATSSPATSRASLRRTAALVEGPRLTRVATKPVLVSDHLKARHYTPQGLPEGSPLLLFLHGGGWVSGDLDTHDDLCRHLAAGAGVRVLSVDYRLAPEHRFPAAADDADTAYRFAVANAERLGADPARIALGGDSAGGNLAASAALGAADADHRPAFLLLLYPSLDATATGGSRDLFARGFFLTRPKMDWFMGNYAPDLATHRDPRLSPLLAPDLSVMPPTYVATAGLDPLRDEGEAFAARLAESGVPVVLRRHEGLIHGFANALGVGTSGREAVAEAIGALRTGLALRGA